MAVYFPPSSSVIRTWVCGLEVDNLYIQGIRAHLTLHILDFCFMKHICAHSFTGPCKVVHVELACTFRCYVWTGPVIYPEFRQGNWVPEMFFDRSKEWNKAGGLLTVSPCIFETPRAPVAWGRERNTQKRAAVPRQMWWQMWRAHGEASPWVLPEVCLAGKDSQEAEARSWETRLPAVGSVAFICFPNEIPVSEPSP